MAVPPLKVAVRRRLGRIARATGLRKAAVRPKPENMGRVAVVIPAFNESRFLSEALDSLLTQTYKYWRAIVVDDQSSDTTTEIAAGYATRHSRIEVLRLRRNAGLPAARNAGLAQVTEPFVLFLDGDDVLFPDALENRVRTLVADEDAAGVYGRIRQGTVDLDLTEHLKRRRHATDRRVILATSGGENPFGIHEVLLRTDAARALGGFDESLRKGGEDVDFWARALRSGMEFPGTGQVDCLYRQTPTSMVTAGVIDHMDTVVGLLDAGWRGEAGGAEVLGRSGLQGDIGDVLRRAMVEGRRFKYLGQIGYEGESAALERVRQEILDAAPMVLSRPHVRSMVLSGLTRSARRVGETEEEGLPERADELVTSVEAAFERTSGELAPRRDHPTWAVLLEHRAQAVAVTAALADVPVEAWPAFVLSDTVDAPMGAVDHLAAHHPDAVTRSVPKFLLEGVAYDVLVVPAPASWVGALVAAQVTERGGSVRLLELPFSDGVLVDDEERPATHADGIEPEPQRIAPNELAALAGGRTRTEVRRTASPVPAVTWPGRVRAEGSLGDYRGMPLPSRERLLEMKDAYRGRRAVIIGNGPSLNKTELHLLKGECTFGVNGIYYADERLPEPLTFYVVEDTKVFEENTAEVLAYGRNAEHFILPTLYQPSCGPEDDPIFFRMNGGFYKATDPSYCRPRFSTDASEVLYCGQSVTIINLQLAYWFGFSEIGLIGMDFSYALPTGTEVRGNLYTSAGDDPNHFDPRYFGAGKTWKDPKLNRVLANYELAKAVYESDGRRIVNCTVGGALEAFERMDLADFVNR